MPSAALIPGGRALDVSDVEDEMIEGRDGEGHGMVQRFALTFLWAGAAGVSHWSIVELFGRYGRCQFNTR